MKRLVAVLLISTFAGCADSSRSYQTEFGGLQTVGLQDGGQMSRRDLHSAIEQAYLDGELTSEQARKAHLQLDVKGHLTQEQIRVIHRDRLAKRDTYETRKENLDVLRDVGQTGASVTSDVNNILHNISAIFK